MSTRGEIGFLMNDGTVYSIYNHFDSYLSGLGNDLLNGLKPGEDTLKFVFDLMLEHGDSIYKYKSVDDFASSMEKSDREFLYLWDDNEWRVVTCHYKSSDGSYNHKFLPFCYSQNQWLIAGPNGEVKYSD